MRLRMIECSRVSERHVFIVVHWAIRFHLPNIGGKNTVVYVECKRYKACRG